ncbi:MAG: 50S ribosomal protein L22 [Candidatus Sungbacteria bacterium]|uniref:Large ribosomal subunit protein uL22 n=1 Tax=Candidatus Sungiibacteriota bacterium TaxID=2750080 RepID=A0A931WMS9_9BACT|nr:50S ribosomal protein L22 [Candidatus Sungbacteria bacterium]
MEVTARLHYARMAPRKTRLVANMIKGLPATEALVQLRHLPKRATLPLEKLLRSAIANAKHNFSLDEKNLRVKSALVDGGPMLKRSRSRAFGRVAMIRKRTSHITLVLDEFVPTKMKPKKAKKAAAPVIREASLAEIKEIQREEKSAVSRAADRETGPGQRQPGFVRRLFNRKSV